MLAVFVGIAGFASDTHGQTSYEVVAAFDRQYSLGANPYGGLIQGSDGSFYGTTSQGGAAGSGTIFKIDAAGTLTLLHSFSGGEGTNPSSALTQAPDGSFYGSTQSGGAAGVGTIFKIDATGTLTTVHGFNGRDGASPSGGLIQVSDGSFYGSTQYGGAAGYGTVFKMDAAGTLTTLHSFNNSDGAYPAGGVTQGSDGSLYGLTKYGGALGWYGTIFKIDAAGALTTVHSFNRTDGAYPSGGVTQGSDGSFYGTTSSGGGAVTGYEYGTVFKVDAAGTLTTLHNFNYSDGASPLGGVIQGDDGNFYGTTQAGGSGTIFKLDAAGALTTLHSFNYDEGANPQPLIQGGDGSFYGTTAYGGAAASGTIFKVDGAGTLTTLHRFGALEPRTPQAGVVQASDGSLYGTTNDGGASNRGTVFKIDPAGALTTLHSFVPGEGANPQARLIQANDGSFYGSTSVGVGAPNVSGTSGPGTIFKIDAGGTLTTLHGFNYSDGAGPAGLIQGSDGSFYGTTQGGGVGGSGTIFKIDAAGALTTIHSFNRSDGAYPSSGVTQGSDGSFYGTTSWGGAVPGYEYGTVFKVDAAGTLTTLHDFTYSDGANPGSGLIQGSDGTFYGTTQAGGAAGSGTIFKIDAAGTLTMLHSFNNNDGAAPIGALIQGSDGSFYGTTWFGGASGRGTIFKIDAAGTLTTLHSFDNSDGASPYSGVIQGSNGSFYGTTQSGGNGSGVVFRLTVQTPTSTTLIVTPSPSMFGQSVTLTANVTTNSGTPNGSVEFFDGSASLGTAALNAGTAALHISTFANGSHALHAEYARGGTFAASASAVVTHIVALPATFINPLNHATNVDLTQPFTWTSVAGVQAYYLYVGTSVGAKDLVNTGEIQQTSYPVRLTLASGATLYARLWTKVGGTWRYVDATFSAPPIARFTYPATSITTIDPTLPLTWTPVPAAQAYYLYVGSTLGAKDLVNTGELQQTSYLIRTTLPVKQTLYARLWTKVGGVWRFTDRTFTALPLIAHFTNPAVAATTVEPTQPLAWTTAPSAQAYYLYVGSTFGARDLVNTGETQQTSYVIRTLPANQTVYARLWTKVGGAWWYVDTTFALR